MLGIRGILRPFFRASQPSVRRRRQVRLEVEPLEAREVLTITYHGGPLLNNVEVQALFYGNSWANYANLASQASQLDSFLKYVVNSPYMDMLTQAGYYVSRGTWSQGTVANTPVAPYVLDSDLTTALQGQINSGAMQSPDANRFYIIYVEPGVVVNDGAGTSQSQFLGYHSTFTGTDRFGNPTQLYYAVVPYPGAPNATDGNTPFNSMTITTTHELAEGVTDPDTRARHFGWYENNHRDGQDEIADLAYGATSTLAGYLVADVANQQDQVIAPLPPNSNYIGSGVEVVSVAFDSLGRQVTAVVYAGGSLYVFDSAGSHFIGNHVQSVGVAFNPFGQEIMDVVFDNNLLYQYDVNGAHFIGAGVQSVDIAFDGQGRQVTAIAYTSGSLYVFDASGSHYVAPGVAEVSLAYDAQGREVLDLIYSDGTLYQFDATGSHFIGASIQGAAVAFDHKGQQRMDVVFTSSDLYQY